MTNETEWCIAFSYKYFHTKSICGGSWKYYFVKKIIFFCVYSLTSFSTSFTWTWWNLCHVLKVNAKDVRASQHITVFILSGKSQGTCYGLGWYLISDCCSSKMLASWSPRIYRRLFFQLTCSQHCNNQKHRGVKVSGYCERPHILMDGDLICPFWKIAVSCSCRWWVCGAVT